MRKSTSSCHHFTQSFTSEIRRLVQLPFSLSVHLLSKLVIILSLASRFDIPSKWNHHQQVYWWDTATTQMAPYKTVMYAHVMRSNSLLCIYYIIVRYFYIFVARTQAGDAYIIKVTVVPPPLMKNWWIVTLHRRNGWIQVGYYFKAI